MGWTLDLRPSELEAFRRCLRAWDLGARVRRNYVPLVAPAVFDFDRAVRDALAVYYFPGMDDWDRTIVRPLALQAFHRKMREHRASYEARGALDGVQERDFAAHVERGQRILEHYFAWCAGLDEFDSVLADHEFRAPVPDPTSPGLDVVTPDGKAVRYVGRIDQLVNENDEFWIVDHRLATDGWADGDALVGDWVSLSAVWAIEGCYPSMKIAGNVYNEIRADETPPPRDRPIPKELDVRTMDGSRRVNRRRDYLSPKLERAPGEGRDVIVRLETSERFRRTYVRRAKSSIAAIGVRIAADAKAVNAPDLRIVPSRGEERCRACVFRAPCDAMDAGADAASILASRFRLRGQRESMEEESLRYSPAREEAEARAGSRTVRMLWG